MLRIGIFGAMALGVNSYLLPDEAPDHVLYADTRIADPRYARSAEDLVCTMERGPDPFNQPRHEGGGKGGNNKADLSHSKMIPIGCCPAGDPSGTPFGPGHACCCGTVYNDETHFCCDHSCKAYTNTLHGITQCNMDMSPITTENPFHDVTKTMPEPTKTPAWIPEPPEQTEAPFIDYVETGKCAQAWYIPAPMEAQCTDYNNEGSFCAFSCPANLKVRIPEDPNRVCLDQEWHGQVPTCCERDGCPSDLRVDFFFILDSSSSIKDKNFQYVREYVIGLISTMPVGLDKTRVGILTYNNDVIHRVRLNEFDRKSELMAAVNNIPYEGRGTKTNAALEFAVEEALTEENGDRPDVPNFVLVLTDGRATDDVRVGAPKLREKAAVIAVGVGKRIEKKELEHIAGDKGNVFMVADFRSLSGSQSEGSAACADAQIQYQQEIEGSQSGRKRRDIEDLQAHLEAVRAEVADLNNLHENDQIVDATYYSELRRLGLLEGHIQNQLQAELQISSGKGGKGGKKDMDKLCPNLTSSGAAVGEQTTLKFTTSFICPKSCIFDDYVLYYPDNVLSQ